jgi:hypothetical protein
MTGRYSTISIDQVISRAKMQLKLNDGSEEDFLEVLGNEALNNLDCLSLMKKQQKTLCISDCKAKLPCGYYKMLGLRFICSDIVDPENNTIRNNWNNFLYIDKNFLRDCGCEVNENSTLPYRDYQQTFQIVDGWIYFNSYIDAEEVEIAYMGMNVDETGRLLIYEDYERAIVNYICWQFALTNIQLFNQYQIEKYERTWKAQKAKVKADDSRNDFQNTKYQIRKIFNAVLVNGILMNTDSDIW